MPQYQSVGARFVRRLSSGSTFLENNVKHRFVALIGACTLFATAPALLADWSVRGDPVDHANLKVPKIAPGSTIYVKEFSTADANLGKSRHKDTAERLVSVIPHLLAIDLVEELRSDGFDALLDSGEPIPEGSLVLAGRFTDLDPGSQSARVWIGFGAGKSRVCIEGEVTDAQSSLGEFSHCRAGIGWGESDQQVATSADRMAEQVAELLAKWSSGNLQ